MMLTIISINIADIDDRARKTIISTMMMEIHKYHHGKKMMREYGNSFNEKEYTVIGNNVCRHALRLCFVRR
jgi:hypothetical protein